MSMGVVNALENPQEEDLPWKQIVAKAVHDMRTPLSSMVTTLEILRLLPADREKSLKMIGLLDRQVEELSRQLEALVANPSAYLPPAEQRPRVEETMSA